MENITKIENEIAAAETRLSLLKKQREDILHEEVRQGAFGVSVKQMSNLIVKCFGPFVVPGMTVAILLSDWKVYENDVCDLVFKTFYNGRIGNNVFPISACNEIGMATYPAIVSTFFPETVPSVDLPFRTARMLKIFQALRNMGYTAWVEYVQLLDNEENRSQLVNPDVAFANGDPSFMILCLSK